MPACWATLDRARDLGTGRIEERDQPDEAQVALDVVTRLRLRQGASQPPPGDAQHAEPRARIPADRLLDAVAFRGVDGTLVAGGVEHGRAALEHLLGRPLRVDPPTAGTRIVVDRRHQLQACVEVVLLDASHVAMGGIDIGAERARGREKRDLCGITAARRAVRAVEARVVARRHRGREDTERGVVGQCRVASEPIERRGRVS
jgi:hypothetical protein